jgi:branched-chain amino acid transport system substrate-binding protein
LGITVGALCAATALVLVASSTGSNSAAGPIVGQGKASATKSICGLGNGKKARGAAIKLGGIFTLVPGVDFTTIGKIADAYFKCVNDNGGINGRPISFRIYTEQLKPEQNAALAKKLAESDKVVGVVGSTSLIECEVNNKYWQRQGYYMIIAGVPGACFGTPNYAAVNMGPRYSNIGAAQALVRAGAKSIVVSSPDTIAEHANGGPILVAKRAGIPGISDAQPLPITDANSIVVKLVQQAKQAAGGGKGAVILDYTPESALPLMKAAEAQGLVDDVLWGSSTPIANEFTAGQVGSAWNKDNLFINSEFGLLTDKGPDMTLYRQITQKYAKSIPVQSFGQMGFMVGKFVTAALLSVKGPVTKASYNAAVQNLKNVPSDILCKPWYFGKGLKAHIPNNWDRTVSFANGKVVQTEKCFAIAAVDADLVATRNAERRQKLNTGGK